MYRDTNVVFDHVPVSQWNGLLPPQRHLSATLEVSEKLTGMDIAKSVFQLHFVASHDRAALKKKLKRSEVLAFYRVTPACKVGIEACGGAHPWAREIGKLVHSVKLIAPQWVKPDDKLVMALR